MPKTQLEDLLKRCPSIYKLAVVAAKRAKELAEGSPALMQTDSKKVTTIALQEIMQGRIAYEAPETEETAGGGEKKRKRSADKKKS